MSVLVQTQTTERLTLAQAEVLQGLLSLYLIDADLQQRIFENLSGYTDVECEVLKKTIFGLQEKQTEIMTRISQENPESVERFFEIKQEGNMFLKKEEEKMVLADEVADLKALEKEILGL